MSLASGVLAAQRAVAVGDEHRDSARAVEQLLRQPTTVDMRSVTRRQALLAAASESGVPIVFRSSVVDAYSDLVTIQFTHAPLRDVLETILAGTRLMVVPNGGTQLSIVSRRDTTERPDTTARTGTLMGSISDSATGKPMARATVRVEGTALTAVTTDAGRFLIRDVPLGEQRISVRLFGYAPVLRTVTVTTDPSPPIRIRLGTNATVLSGVVTTASGVRRKVEVGSDITTLNADSILKVAPVATVTDLLENRVPGLTVQRTSGTPGDPARLRLRGAGSITGNNDPILIVDGVRMNARQSDARSNNLAPTGTTPYTAPSPLDQIDPNSIETIEVFKGPSASALYGSDAANGVIVIKTKRGRAGPTRVFGLVGLGQTTQQGDWPTNYYRFGKGNNTGTGYFCLWNDLNCHVDSVVAFQALNDSRYTVLGDHGSDQNVSATVSGGVPALLYSLTGSGGRQVGLLKLPGIEVDRYQKFYGTRPPSWMRRPDHYQTWGGNSQLQIVPSPTLNLTLGTTLFSSTQQQSSLQNGISALQGIYVDPTQLSRTPLVRDFYQRAIANALTSTASVSISWQVRPWLPVNGTAGLNGAQRRDETLIPYGLPASGGAQDTLGRYSLGRGTTLDKTVNIGTVVPVGTRVTFSAGLNAYQSSSADVSASTTKLAPGVTVPTTFDPQTSTFTQQTQANATYGWYVQPQLNLNSRFFVAPGFRLDGGSGGTRANLNGGTGGLSGFPKIDLSWLAINRSEQPLWGVISVLRPRIAYGYAGVQPDPKQRLRLLNDYTTSFDGTTTLPTVDVTTIGNTQLRPERRSELEAGFDTDLRNGRVTITATFYNKTTHDAIIEIPVAASVTPGAVNAGNPANGSYFLQPRTIAVNVGVVRNTGSEVTTNIRVIDRALATWSVGGNFSANQNRVVRLNPNFTPPPVTENGNRIVAGYPYPGIWARPIVLFADANRNGIIDRDEVRIGDSSAYVGQQTPKYNLNLTTDLGFLNNRFGIHASFQYVSGQTQFNSGSAVVGTNVVTSGSFLSIANRPGTSLATQAGLVAATLSGTAGNPSSQIGLIQTVSTLRFQTLSFNYVVPRSVASRIRIPVTGIAVLGSNLGLHSNYRGADPNVNGIRSGRGEGVSDTGQLPEPRTWKLQVTLDR